MLITGGGAGIWVTETDFFLLEGMPEGREKKPNQATSQHVVFCLPGMCHRAQVSLVGPFEDVAEGRAKQELT